MFSFSKSRSSLCIILIEFFAIERERLAEDLPTDDDIDRDYRDCNVSEDDESPWFNRNWDTEQWPQWLREQVCMFQGVFKL